jgi:hypothetical protein
MELISGVLGGESSSEQLYEEYLVEIDLQPELIVRAFFPKSNFLDLAHNVLGPCVDVLVLECLDGLLNFSR